MVCAPGAGDAQCLNLGTEVVHLLERHSRRVPQRVKHDLVLIFLRLCALNAHPPPAASAPGVVHRGHAGSAPHPHVRGLGPGLKPRAHRAPLHFHRPVSS
jgi:hypothetical protein